MELNADFSRRAVVHAARLPWSPSPIAGVERRMLDRVGEEVARATSIVRYAPNSRFSPHSHGGGEEIFVLDGVFSDEHGDFAAGCYLRNPPGSRHTPGSAPGCTIFVKLWQFDPADRRELRIDTTKAPLLPAPDRPGVAVMPLFQDAGETVRLEHWRAGASVALSHPGGTEALVLEGGFSADAEPFAPQSWLRLPGGVALAACAAASGCRLWVKTGHLARPQAAPATAAPS